MGAGWEFQGLSGEAGYLLWERNFPVAWPEPSQPGIGHLKGSDSAPSLCRDFGLLARGHPDSDLRMLKVSQSANEREKSKI